MYVLDDDLSESKERLHVMTHTHIYSGAQPYGALSRGSNTTHVGMNSTYRREAPWTGIAYLELEQAHQIHSKHPHRRRHHLHRGTKQQGINGTDARAKRSSYRFVFIQYNSSSLSFLLL